MNNDKYLAVRGPVEGASVKKMKVALEPVEAPDPDAEEEAEEEEDAGAAPDPDAEGDEKDEE